MDTATSNRVDSVPSVRQIDFGSGQIETATSNRADLIVFSRITTDRSNGFSSSQMAKDKSNRLGLDVLNMCRSIYEMLIHESYVFGLRVETKFEVCESRSVLFIIIIIFNATYVVTRKA